MDFSSHTFAIRIARAFVPPSVQVEKHEDAIVATDIDAITPVSGPLVQQLQITLTLPVTDELVSTDAPVICVSVEVTEEFEAIVAIVREEVHIAMLK